MSILSESTGVVVLGGHVSGLGLVRSFGEHGIPVLLIDKTPLCIARYSRYCTEFRHCPQLDNGDALVVFLLRLADELSLQGYTVFPTSDATLEILSRHRPALAEVFRIPVPDWKTVRLAHCKDLTADLARSLGLPTPMAVTIDADWEPTLWLTKGGGFPALIKPTVMHRFYGATRQKAVRVDTAESCQKVIDRLRLRFPDQRFMIQELIVGPPASIVSFCSFTVGGVIGPFFIDRHLRQIPMDIGKAATCVELISDPLVYQQAAALLGALQFTGISEVEFKYDSTGRALLLEINARPWKQLRAGRLVGIDIAGAAWRHSVGHPEHTPTAPLTRVAYDARLAACNTPCWIDLVQDLPMVLKELLGRRLSIKATVEQYRGLTEFAVCSRTDPLPFAMELLFLPYLFLSR